MKKVKNGVLNISSDQYYNAKNRLNYFKEIIDNYKDVPRIYLLLQGLLYCYYINEVNLYRIKNKILDVLQLGKLPPIPTMNDIMQFLEEVYNKNSHNKYVYIYTEYRKMQIDKILRNKEVYKYLKEESKKDEL